MQSWAAEVEPPALRPLTGAACADHPAPRDDTIRIDLVVPSDLAFCEPGELVIGERNRDADPIKKLDLPAGGNSGYVTRRSMKVLYFDAFAGISGDMAVGALLALGLPLDHLRQALSQLPLGEYLITATPQQVHGITGTKFQVQVAAAGQTHRSFRDIRQMLDGSTLEPAVKQCAIGIFAKLAEAEGRIHAVQPDEVQFHEIGAVDSIIDIVGTALGIVWLGAERVYVSPLPLGTGLVQSQHGTLPVPAPATVELLRGFVTHPVDGEGELVTPTGAAIIASLASPERVPALRLQASGYGAGQRRLTDRPNLLRAILGQLVASIERDDVIVIETNIDDYNPELYEYVIDRLFTAGARDVYLTPVHMKKNRPGVQLTVLCSESDRDHLAGIVLSETSAIGLRYYAAQRVVLPREMREVTTPHGTVRVKVARSADGHENIAPEYEDCKRLAQINNVPIKLVYQAALAAALGSGRNK